MIKSYDELTIAKYRELMNIEKGNDDTEYGILILSVLSGIEPDELLELSLDKFTSLMKQTNFIYTPIVKKDYKDIGKTITINDKEYKIIKNARDLTAGQYIDYKAYIGKDNFLDMLPYILTVFLVPDGHKYNNGYDVVELAKELDNNLDLPTALAISDFFLHQSTLSIRSSVIYLKWKMRRMAKKEKNTELKEKIMECMGQLESLENLLCNLDGCTQQ